jgi:hypothetical protein
LSISKLGGRNVAARRCTKTKTRRRALPILANQLIPFYIGSPLFLKIEPMRQAILKIKALLTAWVVPNPSSKSDNLEIIFLRKCPFKLLYSEAEKSRHESRFYHRLDSDSRAMEKARSQNLQSNISLSLKPNSKMFRVLIRNR